MIAGTVLAVVPARGGSKGLPGKNLLPLGSIPLLVHSIRAALECPLVTRCVVTTEDEAIKAVARAAGADVIDRPAELASDTARTNEAVSHALRVLESQGWVPEMLALLQPTSPLRTAGHLEEALKAFAADREANSLISVTPAEHHPYKDVRISEGRLVPLFGRDELEMPRQKLPAVYRPNGALFIIRTSTFLETERFFVDPVLPFIMSAEESIDIDSRFDLQVAEALLAGRGREGS